MKTRLSDHSFAFSYTILSSVLVGLLGLVVLIGWYTQNLNLIQVNPAFVAMQYNTALGFLLAGLGLLAMAGPYLRIATLVGLLTLLLGFATLVQYIAGVDLGIDQLFMTHYVNIQSSHPGRMAPNTALCFSLSGLSILLIAFYKQHKATNGVVGVLGVMILGLGMVALSGYFTGMETAYGWGQLTKMAIHTALGFILLGGGFFAFAWYHESLLYQGKPKWLYLPIGIASITITLAFWQALVAQTQAQFEFSGYNSIVDECVLFFGTLLSLILVYISRSILLQGSQQRNAMLTYAPLVVLAAGLFLGLSLFSLLHHHFQDTVYNKFKAAVQSHVKSLEYGITPYLEALFSIRAGFDASNFIDRSEFHSLVKRLGKQYPGIKALQWVPKVSSSQRAQYETLVKGSIMPDFSFMEQNSQGDIVTAQQRDEYYPIYYVDPLLSNSKVLGFDLGSDSQEFAGMMKSVRINAPVASQRLTLFQSNADSYDFIVSLPVFDRDSLTNTPGQRLKSLQGFAVVVLNIGEMIEAILARHADMAGLEIEFLDVDSSSGEQFLYLHKPYAKKNRVQKADIDTQSHYQTDVTMKFADREWKIKAVSANSELYPEWSSSSLHLPVAILILSAVLAFYLRRAGLREIERNEMLAYQTALLDAIPNPIFVFNDQAEFTSCNKAYEQFFAIRREDYLGKVANDLDYYSEATKRTFESANLAMNRTKGSAHEEISIINHDQQQYNIIYWRTAFSLGNGKSAGMIGILIDVTELKQAQKTAEESQRYAEEANQAKSDFLANMSHEIRTPMNAVIGMSYLALQTNLTSKQSNYIEKVHRSAEALLGIINDILDFSKIEAGKLSMEFIDFRFEDVLDNLANLLGLKAEERGLELLFDIDPTMPMALQGDPLRLGQILINLGNNAVKFTEQGEVVLSTQVLEADEKQIKVQFSVRDTGIGMSEEQQKKLFQSFVQADGSTTRKFGGTGLGLVICKKLTELMGGEIWLKSTPGQGTTFSFTAVFGKAVDTLESIQFNTVDNLNVLVVDDNKSSREIMAGMLQSFTYTTATATSGYEAIQQIKVAEQQRQPYDLIIMDWKMPGMDGVETIRQLKVDPKLNNVPTIIMVTAYGKEELTDKVKDLEQLSFLTKPTNASFLFDTIMTAFGHKITSRSRRSERREDYTEAVQQLRGANILLVEDNEINQELALELLANGGVNASLAVNGQQAVEKILEQSFDGVLMDIQMPVMDGYTATQAIRKLEQGKQLPIIAMTANAMTSDIEQALQSGMNDHISKPIHVAEMFCTMAKWISPSTTLKPIAEDDNNDNEMPNEIENKVPDLKGIDYSAGLAIVQGNNKLYRRLLIKFMQSEQNFTEQFHQAQESDDKDAAMRVAHTLNGVAGNVGATGIHKAAKALEQACKSGADNEQIEILLDRVEVELIPVLESLKQLQSEPGQIQVMTKERTVDTEKLSLLFEKLMQFLNDDDADAIEILEEIVSLMDDGTVTGQLNELQTLIEQYSYDEAIELVKVISDRIF